MAATSKNKYDVYFWLCKVINTSGCVKKGTPYKRDIRSEQFNNCHKLINNFYKIYNDIDLFNELRYKLLKKAYASNVNRLKLKI